MFSPQRSPMKSQLNLFHRHKYPNTILLPHLGPCLSHQTYSLLPHSKQGLLTSALLVTRSTSLSKISGLIKTLRNGEEKVRSQHQMQTMHSNLYIKEDLISLQAELMDSVISYDPIALASKLTFRSEEFATSSTDGSSIFKMADNLKSYLFSILRSSSPVLLAYSQYKSTGYPWTIGCLPPSLIVILSVKYLEISPPTTRFNNISSKMIDSSDMLTDPMSSDVGNGVPVSFYEKPKINEWRRWSLTYIDPYPQWRTFALCSDEIAAVGYSNGIIEILYLSTAENSRIIIKKPIECEFAPIVGLYFLQDSFHLLVCRFSGSMEIWNLRRKSAGYAALLVCQILRDAPLFSTVYDPKSFFLVLGGEFVGSGSDSLMLYSLKDLSFNEISLSNSPNSNNTNTSGTQMKFRSLIRSIAARQSSNLVDGFVSLSLSPDGNFLCALHCTRAISIWTFPTCSLLTTIISDAVSIDSSILSCKPLSPFLNYKVKVPLHLNWWRRSSQDPFLAILKSDGSLSVIDIETLENQLFNIDNNQKGGTIQVAPFTSFAAINAAESNKTELFMLECTLKNLRKDTKNVLHSTRTQWRYLGRMAAVLGISRKVGGECEFGDQPEIEFTPTLLKANIVRIASTSGPELCTHRMRSCRFSEALNLICNNGVEVDSESVWQYQFLALFHFPVKPATFERLISLCIQKITSKDDWLLRECLCEIPRVNESSWDTVDLFHCTRFLLNSGLSRSTNASTKDLFRERIYHIDIITRIYAEECATSLASKCDTPDYDYARDVEARWLEIEVYRQNHPLAIALWYLHSNRYIAFAILLSHYPAILAPHLISLLSTVSVTESPSSFLRPIMQFPSEMSNGIPPLSDLIESRYQIALNRLTTLLPVDFQWTNTSPTYSSFVNWACSRAFELDRMTGIVTNSVELLQGATDIIKSNAYVGNAKLSRSKCRALQLLERHLNEANQFASIIYRASAGYGFSNTLRRKIDLGGGIMICLNQVKLSEFHKFTSEQRLEMLIRACIASPSKVKAMDVFRILTDSLLPFITTFEKETLEPRLKQCLLRVAEFCNAGFEAITILAKQWQAGNVALITALEDISFKQCLIDFLVKFTRSSTEDPEAYLHHAQELLSSLIQTQNDDGEDGRLQRLSECCNALLEYYALVRELGYFAPPQGIPTSLGDALTFSTEPSRLMQLVNRWIRSTLIAQSGRQQRRKSPTQENVASNAIDASSPLQAVKKHTYFYNTAAEESTRSSEIVEEKSVLIGTFQCLCGALTRLLGANTNEEARYYLLVGVLCSGDRCLIDFAKSELVKDAEHDPVWVKSLQYATGVYFDATPGFGMGEVNEELGALCLSFLPSSKDSPDATFYSAVKFLAGLECLNSRSSRFPSRSKWLKMKQESKAELFTSALQKLLYLTYMTEVNLMQAGQYFGLSEIEVSRCFLRAAIQAASVKPLPSGAIEKTVNVMQKILSTPESSAWREVRLWSRAPIEILSSFFPSLKEAVVERFRLTLARFVIVHSVFEASCREYACISSEFMDICASQKPHSVELENPSRITQRIISALSSTSSSSREYSGINDTKPYLPCRFYASPLDPIELENCSTSPSLLAFFSSITSTGMLDADAIHEIWVRGCLDACDLDIGLSYAYGPPLGLKPRNWTKLLCTRISDRIHPGVRDNNPMETYRIVAASVSASTPPTCPNALFPSTKVLLESLSRLAVKHPRIAQWRSKALVSQLVGDPDKFFSDANYRRNELMLISQTSHEVSLLIAKYMQESVSQLVLSNLSAIVFSDPSIESDEIKRQLKKISPYLKRDVSVEELSTYLHEIVDPRVEDILLYRIYLLLKVFHVIVGDTHPGLILRGDHILTHLNLMPMVMHLDSSVYFALLSALHESLPENVMTRVRPLLTQKSTVKALITLVQHYESSSKDVTKAQVFAAYASNLLENLKYPVEDFSECLDSMIESSGDANFLVNWISENLFGQKALVRPLDLSGTMALVDAAIKVIRSRPGNDKSLHTMARLKSDLQYRSAWIQEQSAESSLCNDSLLQNIALHHFTDTESVPTLILQATHDFISKSSSHDSSKPFSVILSSFIAFIEHIAGLVCRDFDEVVLTALCGAINEFISVTVVDWIHLDGSSRSDLEKSDEIIVNFVRSKATNHHDLVISHLLSLSSLRQIFGKVILNVIPSLDHQRILIQNAFTRVLSQVGLPFDSMENLIERLLGYLQATEVPDDPVMCILGEEGLKNAGLVQAAAIAIDLSGLYLSKDSNENELKVWQSWLRCFTQHPFLPRFSRQLISRVHMARNPSESYLKAVGSLESEDPKLIEAIQSARLLAPSPDCDILTGLPEGIKLDPISCRRFISRSGILKKENLRSSILEAILEVTGNPRYDTFLRQVLNEMRTSGIWLEMVLIGRALMARKQRTGSMREVLLNIETFLSIS